MIVTYELEQLV